MRRRWHDVRMRFIPAAVFSAALIAVIFLWKDYVAAPTMVGQAEPVQVSVSSYKPGMLAQLKVVRFQKVAAGDEIGQVLVTDPKILASSLAVIQSEIEVLRTGMGPVAAQQRTAMNYDRLRLDGMEQRAKLAMAKVNLELAGTEFHRMEELFKEKIVSQRVFEQAKAAQDRLQSEVDELSRLVREEEQNASLLQVTNRADLAKVSDDPLRAAIAVQESKLRLTEAELSPITLKAPVDGMINLVYHRSGEAITAGEPIVAIASFNSVRIIGYLRPPILTEPKVGMVVDVRTRGPHRKSAAAKVVEVGTQLETVAPALLPTVKSAAMELGLPLSISLPANLELRPGELVDLTLLPGGS
jgi:multidrug resistance efflux pump